MNNKAVLLLSIVCFVLFLIFFLTSSSSFSSSPPTTPTSTSAALPESSIQSQNLRLQFQEEQKKNKRAQNLLDEKLDKRIQRALNEIDPRKFGRQLYWKPQLCLNFFAGGESLVKIYQTVNWSTPIRPYLHLERQRFLAKMKKKKVKLWNKIRNGRGKEEEHHQQQEQREKSLVEHEKIKLEELKEQRRIRTHIALNSPCSYWRTGIWPSSSFSSSSSYSSIFHDQEQEDEEDDEDDEVNNNNIENLLLFKGSFKWFRAAALTQIPETCLTPSKKEVQERIKRSSSPFLGSPFSEWKKPSARKMTSNNDTEKFREAKQLDQKIEEQQQKEEKDFDVDDNTKKKKKNSNSNSSSSSSSSVSPSMLRRLRLQKRECALGLCWLKSVASLVAGKRASTQAEQEMRKIARKRRILLRRGKLKVKKKEEEEGSQVLLNDFTLTPRRVPFFMLIGDSRVRNLWQRFIMMVRSNKKTGHEEMKRPGVVDNYFHLNATYVVTEMGDEVTVLPSGEGCESKFVLDQVNYDFVSTSSSSSSSSSTNNKKSKRERREKITRRRKRPILVVCFEWHSRTVFEQQAKWDIDIHRLISKAKPDVALWMPTLHDCIQRRCEQNNAMVGNIQRFVEMLAQELAWGNIRNRLVLLTTPTAVWAKSEHIYARNQALKLVAGDFQRQFDFDSAAGSGSSSSHVASAASGSHNVNSSFSFSFARSSVSKQNEHAVENEEDDHDDDDDKNYEDSEAKQLQQINEKQQEEKDDREEQQEQQQNQDQLLQNQFGPTLTSNSLQVVDAAKWIHRRKPMRCDRVHTMCNFRPMMGYGNITHFRAVCPSQCSDVADYCFWMQIRKALT